MGGKGSGGGRVGAGRKSKRTSERFPGGKYGTAPLDAAAPAVTGVAPVVVPMPDSLTPRAQAAWQRNAPLALAQGTLTAESAEGFAELCESIGRLEAVRAEIGDRLMVDGQKNPLLTEERQFLLRVEAGRKCFMLMPIGKPLTKAPEEVDPFAEFDEPADIRLVKGA